MKCSNCKTENGYLRLKDRSWVCRKCGKITDEWNDIETKEKEEVKKECDTNEPNIS